jgi:hypothetical protein
MARLLLLIFGLQLLLPFAIFTAIRIVKFSQHQAGQRQHSLRVLLTNLEFKNAEFPEDGEILLHGELYDICHIEKKNHGYILDLVADKAERRLKEIGRSLTGGSQIGEDETETGTGGFFSSLHFFFFESPAANVLFRPLAGTPAFSPGDECLPLLCLDVASPPPDQA